MTAFLHEPERSSGREGVPPGADEAAPAGGTASIGGRDRLLSAVAGRPVDATPVWFMRQAGGALPGYLALRERYSVEQIATTPELCAEVSLMPLAAYGVDAAVMFADIMLPIAAMGLELELTPSGPVLAAPIRSSDDLVRLRPLEPEHDVRPILDAIRHVRAAVGSRAAVIGIAGGPFTLAGYVIEGEASRELVRTKTLMRRAPTLWAQLLDRLTVASTAYVAAQVRAGADVIQVFDTWAGVLGPTDYERFAAPWSGRLLDAVRTAGVPSIHAVRQSAGMLEQVAAAGGDVLAIDHLQSLSGARARLGFERPVQGNHDPTSFAGGWPTVRDEARRVLGEVGPTPGHIFNLGQPAPRDTDPGLLRELAAFVHASSASSADGTQPGLIGGSR